MTTSVTIKAIMTSLVGRWKM